MFNKIKYFILTFLSVFLTFINSSAIDNIKLNASSPEIMFKEKLSDNYFTEKSVKAGFIEDFICSKKLTNSKLHYEADYISAKDMYYSHLDFSEEENKWNPTIIFDDVFYNTYRNENEYGIFSMGNTYINQWDYDEPYPEYLTELTLWDMYGADTDYLGEIWHPDKGMFIKRGFSVINGVSLVANDIFINTKFDISLSANNNIDLALCNTSNFNINWTELLNRVCYNITNCYKHYLNNNNNSYYSPAWTFQFPLIKVDGDEFVNVVFNPYGAYIVTHNCSFAISSDGKEVYLSLPYMNFIEKITISVPFFTGGVTEYLTDYGENGNRDLYITNYMAAVYYTDNIASQIQEVMTSFVPKLWNNDSRGFLTEKFLGINLHRRLYTWCPLQVYDFKKESGIVDFYSKVKLNFDVDKFTINYQKNLLNNFININMTSECVNTIEAHILGKNSDYAYGIEDNNIYSYMTNISELDYSSNFGFSVSDLFYTIQYNNYTICPYLRDDKVIESSIKYANNIKLAKSESANVENQFNTEFMYVSDKTAKIIHGKYRYHSWINPSFWEASFGGEPYWIVNNVRDENNSRREFVYIDFFWDSALDNKIDNIDSVYIVLPKYNDKKIESIVIEKDNILSTIENPQDESWNFTTLYESQVDGHYHFFGMPSETGMFYDENTLNGALTYFDNYNCRFVYSHYNGKKGEESIHRLADELISDDSTSCFAQLKVIVDADTIVKCTTAENGLHIEFDDEGAVLGIFDQFGNLQDDYSVDDDGYIVNTETGEKPTNYYDYKNIQKYHDENYEKWVLENTFWGKFKSFFNNIGDFFTEGGFKSLIIGLLSVVGVVIVVFVGVKIKKVISFAKMKGDVKKLKNKPRKKVKKRKK